MISFDEKLLLVACEMNEVLIHVFEDNICPQTEKIELLDKKIKSVDLRQASGDEIKH